MLVSLDTTLFETDDLDAAIELASCIPGARHGGAIEVRPSLPIGSRTEIPSSQQF
jgi:hypothetical protein